MTEQKIDQFLFDLSVLHLECDDAAQRIEKIQDIASVLKLKFRAKAALSKYLNASKGLIVELDRLNDQISELSLELGKSHYREFLNDMPELSKKLDESLKKIVTDE